MYAMRGLFNSDRPDLTLLDMMVMTGQNFTRREGEKYSKDLEKKVDKDCKNGEIE